MKARFTFKNSYSVNKICQETIKIMIDNQSGRAEI